MMAAGVVAPLFVDAAIACSEPDDGAPEVELATPMNDTMPPWLVRVPGLTAAASQAGDTCVVAPAFPGLAVTSVRIVDGRSGQSVGFQEFKPDPAATAEMCGYQTSGCAAFVAVLDRDIAAGTPLSIVIEAGSDPDTTSSQVYAIAREIVMGGMIAMGKRVEKEDHPDHMSFVRPALVSLVEASHIQVTDGH